MEHLDRRSARGGTAQGILRNGVYLYGFVAVEVGGRSYGAFQTKGHFRDRADLGLVLVSPERVRVAYRGKGLGA